MEEASAAAATISARISRCEDDDDDDVTEKWKQKN